MGGEDGRAAEAGRRAHHPHVPASRPGLRAAIQHDSARLRGNEEVLKPPGFFIESIQDNDVAVEPRKVYYAQ